MPSLTAPNHNDAASALMALATNAENASEKETSEDTDTHMEVEMESAASATTSPVTSPSMKQTAAAAAAAASRFPTKLMSVLNSDEYNKIITWSADGKSFVFVDSNAFERIVLPSIFKVAKFDSFLRKLYRWGFSKCQTHSRVGCPAYKHEKFLRDNPEAMSEMECRSKPKTQYGNAAPMTLNAFHQSAPQLSGHARDAALHSTITNAVWDQIRGGLNPPMTSSGSINQPFGLNNVDTRIGIGDTMMTDHQNHLSDMDNQRRILENAQAALRKNHSPTASAQAAAQQLLNASNSQSATALQLNRQQFLNQQAASMGHSLMTEGTSSNAAEGMFENQQVQASSADQAHALSSRSKTTPFNMKYMEQAESALAGSLFSDQQAARSTPFNMKFMQPPHRPPSAQNSTFQLGSQNPSAAGVDRSMFSQHRMNTQSFSASVNSHQRGTKRLMEDAQNATSNLIGAGSVGNSSVEQSLAELRALRQAQMLSPNPLLNGINGISSPSVDAMSSESSTLQLLRLSEERNRLSDEMRSRIRLQNEVERLQLQNEVDRRMRLQNDFGRQAQLQGEADRFRLLSEVDRRMQVQNEVARQAQLEEEARLALIAKIARGNNRPFGP